MIVQTLRGDFGLLLDFLVCQIVGSFHAFLGLSFHITGPRDGVRVGSLPARQLFDSTCSDLRVLHDLQIRLAFTLRTSQVFLICQHRRRETSPFRGT